MVVEIASSILKVGISSVGGNIVSIVYLPSGAELQWQKDKRVWNAQDLIMFPIIGSGDYVAEGKNYRCDLRHGFARNQEWSVVKTCGNCVELLLCDNAETKRQYPYGFRLTARYLLEKDILTVIYKVYADDGKPVAYCIGGHLGMSLFGEACASFPQKTKLMYRPLIDGLASSQASVFDVTDRIVLDKKLFARYDTLILENNFNSITVENERYVYVYRLDSPIVALWSNSFEGSFVCVEPWWGICSSQGDCRELNKREFVNISESQEFSYSIQITEKIN